MDRAASAVDAFESGFNCTQAVLTAFSEQLGLDKEIALRLACGFGAGMGRQQRTCGAVSGAYMVLGLKCGSFEQDNIRGPRELTYSLIREFTKEFEERNGTTDCRELIGVDLTADDQTLVAQRVARICPRMCQDAAEIVAAIMDRTDKTEV